jgi:hypothetical protein
MHSLLLFFIFAVIQGLHLGLTHVLKFPTNKKFFGIVPIEWLFDGADLVLLVAVGIVGVHAAIQSYRGKD